MSSSTRQRKVAGWAILTALVLGSAYWATRPGSDTPAANGRASAREYAPIERFVQDEMKVQRIPGLALGHRRGTTASPTCAASARPTTPVGR